MIGEMTQRVYREICDMKRPLSQLEIAGRCGCSHSFVNKEIGDLLRRRIVGRPARTRVSLVNKSGLLSLWMGKRGIRNQESMILKTDLDEDEVLSRIADTKTHALTLESAVRAMGIEEGVAINEVQVYLSPGATEGMGMKEGKKGASVRIFVSSDDHLYGMSREIDGVRVAPVSQVYVDLADWGTWGAHDAAVRLAMDNDDFPILATRQELESYL